MEMGSSASVPPLGRRYIETLELACDWLEEVVTALSWEKQL